MRVDILIDLLSVAGFSALGVFVWLLRPPRPFWPVLPQLIVAAFTFVLGDAISALAQNRTWEWIGLIVLYLGSFGVAGISFLLAVGFAEFEGLQLGRLGRMARVAGYTFLAISWLVVLSAPLHRRFATPLTGSRSHYHELWWALVLPAWTFILAGILLYAIVLTTRSGSGVRARASLMLVASLLPFGANLLYTQTRLPLTLDPTILANLVAAALFVVGIYRSRLFSLLPALLPEVLDSEPSGVVLLDDEGTVVWSNAAARRLAGVAGGQQERLLEELLGRLHPQEEGTGHPLATDWLRNQESGTRDAVCSYEGDPSRWLRLEVSHIPVAKKRATLLRLRDVSAQRRSELERRRLEQRMRESERLESLGVLTGGIAHDFNNLLTVILGNAELARGAPSRRSDTSRPLDEIRRAAQKAADLVQQMLIYAGRSPTVKLTFDVSKLLAEGDPSIRDAADARTTLDLAPDLPRIEGDPKQIRQAVFNLVTNSAEAGPSDGEPVHIEVRTRLATLTDRHLQQAVIGADQETGERVLIEVADDGHGIDADSSSRIFEPFFSTKFTGRGLGLAVVLGVLRQHDGVLTFESSPGGGSTFRIWLPIAPSGAAEQAQNFTR